MQVVAETFGNGIGERAKNKTEPFPGAPVLKVAVRTLKYEIVSGWWWFEFEWGFDALSASKAIFRAKTYNCITYSVR